MGSDAKPSLLIEADLGGSGVADGRNKSLADVGFNNAGIASDQLSPSARGSQNAPRSAFVKVMSARRRAWAALLWLGFAMPTHAAFSIHPGLAAEMIHSPPPATREIDLDDTAASTPDSMVLTTAVTGVSGLTWSPKQDAIAFYEFYGRRLRTLELLNTKETIIEKLSSHYLNEPLVMLPGDILVGEPPTWSDTQAAFSLYDAKAGQYIKDILGFGSPTNRFSNWAFHIAAGGGILAATYLKQSPIEFAVYDTANWSVLYSHEPLDSFEEISDLAIAANGGTVAIARATYVEVLETKTFKTLARISLPADPRVCCIDSVSLSEDGSRIAVGKAFTHDEGKRLPRVSVYSMSNGSVDITQQMLSSTAVWEVRLSPDGRTLAASTQTAFHIIDLHSGIDQRAPGHANSLAFAPDSRMLAAAFPTSSVNTDIRLYNIKNGAGR